MKLYPSQYTPTSGTTTAASYPEGCLRYISVKHLIPRTSDIHPIYQAIGTLAEERLAYKIGQNTFMDREVAFQHDIGNGMILSGRADFLLHDRVIECKASISASKRAMWRKDLPDPHHLGQLITYMLVFKRELGQLMCSYVHFNRDMELSFEEFSFTVQIWDSDYITVNGTMLALRVSDVLRFYSLAARAMTSSEIPPRPATEKPCKLCPFRGICDSGPQDRETFTREVRHVLDEVGVPVGGYEPTIKVHNRANT